MAADPVEDAWMETCLIEVQRQGDTEALNMAGITETIDFDIGEKDIEGIPMVSGGRVTKWSPEGDTSLTIEGYPLQAGTIDSATTGTGFTDLLHTQDTTVPIRVVNTRNRDKHRVLVMWTNDSTATTAASITAADASALRIGIAEARCTSAKWSFTDDILKCTAIFKCAAFDKSGSGNVLVESAAGGSAPDLVPAIAAYTSANKFG